MLAAEAAAVAAELVVDVAAVDELAALEVIVLVELVVEQELVLVLELVVTVVALLGFALVVHKAEVGEDAKAVVLQAAVVEGIVDYAIDEGTTKLHKIIKNMMS
ncbi:unnamed protein product [Strongylus vulgaris]|uniref:Uncharacterized protein n=1 Tax=Strongylus vulgaris TaxID=40348 RepID=A0A3P7L6F2_STRVU|nr:unnamed protein product [Strongylus vulgaris]